jgi:Tol biopolymer transport system component
MESYSGEGVETIGMVSKAGVFADGRYVTNIYVGSELFVVKTLMWVVGEPPTPMPTMTSTPIPTPVPPTPLPSELTPAPPVPTPTPIPTPSGPLPSGLKIVYWESELPITDYGTPRDYLGLATTFWIANANNVADRRSIATVFRRGGNPVHAQLSPDGSKIAYTIVPPNVGSSGIMFGAVLWVINVDGTGQMQLDEGVFPGTMGKYPLWSPNSSTVVYIKYILKPGAELTDDNITKELHAAAADGSGTRRLLADPAYIYPLDWSPDGRLLYYLRVPEIWALDLESGESRPQLSFDKPIVGLPLISPDGLEVVVQVREGQGPPVSHALMVLSLNGMKRETITQGAPGGAPDKYYSPIWSPDGTEITTLIPTQTVGERAEIRSLSRHTREWRTIPAVATTGEQYDLPLAWSPDGEWLLVTHRPAGRRYLVRRNTGQYQQLPEYGGALVGWITK